MRGTTRLSHWRTPLAGAGLLTWLLAFPFYGPLLAPWQEGYPGVLAAHFFALSHAAALAVGSLLPLPAPVLRAACGALVPVAVLVWWAPAGPVSWAAMVLAGALAAVAVLGWLHAVAGEPRPVRGFAAAVTAANLALWALTWPGTPPLPRWLAGALATLPLLGALLTWPRAPASTQAPGAGAPPTPPGTSQSGPGACWLAFAAVAYATGGLMYRGLLPVAADLPLLAWLGTAPYLAGLLIGLHLAGGLAAGGQPARGPRPGRLIPWTLAALGAGLALTAVAPEGPPLFVLAWCMVQAGLGLADAATWVFAIQAVREGRPAAPGLLLGFSVAVLTATGILADGLNAGQWVRLPVVGAVGSLALFALVPFLPSLAAAAAVPSGAAPNAGRAPLATAAPPGKPGAHPPATPPAAPPAAGGPPPDAPPLDAPPPAETPAPAPPQTGGEAAPDGTALPLPTLTPLLERLAQESRLTRAELQVLVRLLAGATDADLVASLHISRNTVKVHVRNVLRKLHCRNRKELLERYAAHVLPHGPGPANGKASVT